MTEANEDDDLQAAEYVLGTLDVEERRAAEVRLGADPGFAASVASWERRFSSLFLASPRVEPPAQVYAAVVRRLFGAPRPEAASQDPRLIVLSRAVRRWRVATAGMGALAAAILAWALVTPPPSASGRFTAVLQRDAGAPAIVLDVDVASRRLTVRPVSTTEPDGRSLELWLINPELGAPRSLGTVAPNAVTRASLSSYDAAVIARATYAVTLEPTGGSPTGAPTSTPILTGRLSSDN